MRGLKKIQRSNKNARQASRMPLPYELCTPAKEKAHIRILGALFLQLKKSKRIIQFWLFYEVLLGKQPFFAVLIAVQFVASHLLILVTL